MKNKKAIAWFWWILLILFAVVVFIGVYLLISGKTINDFFSYERGTGGAASSQAGVSDSGAGDDSSATSDSGSGGTSSSGGWQGWGNASNASNISSSGVDISTLPSPPILPS